MITRRPTFAVLTAAAALAVAGLAMPPASGAQGRQDVPRSAPSWVKGARSQGKASATGTSTFQVFLQPHGGTAALRATVASVSDPRSASYGRFLSSAQYAARFDPTASDVKVVADYLRSQKLSVTETGSHNRYLTVHGSNAAVESALGVSLQRYSHLGQTVQANTSAVSLPSQVAGLVSSVSGLDTTEYALHHHATTPAGARTGTPCSSFYGQRSGATKADGTALPAFEQKTLPYAPCGYTGRQLRSAYAGTTALTGAGATVAILDAYAAPTIAADAATWSRRNGTGALDLEQVLPKNFRRNGACGENGWWGEETLDVEAVNGIAPGAKILYYGAASCYDDDFLLALQRIVDDNRASIVSNSWGGLETETDQTLAAAYDSIFMEGAAKGIGFLFSSGDDGDEQASSGTTQADFPTSSPYVTSVGGTSDAIGATGSLLFQNGWETEKFDLAADSGSWTSAGFLYGAGGGISLLYDRPAWQPQSATGSTKRAVPDTAMTGDPTTGMLVGQTQKFKDGTYYDEYRLGGTSLAAPLFAGMTALRTQAKGGRVGFLNPAIYQNANAFRDVSGHTGDAGVVRADYANGVDATGGLVYSVRAFDRASSLSTDPGWDDVTGVGSPTPAWFAIP